MSLPLLSWDVYEITAAETAIHGVMLRGRLRKWALQREMNLLCENASDKENCVRFALPAGTKATELERFVVGLVADARINLVLPAVANPVLSKLKVNREERYEI